jgi:hypothetical protein
MFSNRIVASSGFALLLTALAGCGGSGGSDAPGTTLNTPLATDQTTVGQITGFGSVYVNGIEFDTAGASYEVDDALASDDDALAVGMVVKVEGSVNADGLFIRRRHRGRRRGPDGHGRCRHQDLPGHGRDGGRRREQDEFRQ